MITVKIKATFVGQNSKYGYIDGKSYHLLMMQKKDSGKISISARFLDTKAKVQPAAIKYDNFKKFFNEWKDVMSQEMVTEEKELTIYNVATIMVQNILSGYSESEFEKWFQDECKAVIIGALMNYIVSNNLLPSEELAARLSVINEELYATEDYNDLADAINSIHKSIKNRP